MNGDGNLDLIVVGGNSSGDWSYSVLLGNGDGRHGIYFEEEKLLGMVLASLMISGLLFLAACGGGSTGGTPAGTYTISISGSAGAVVNATHQSYINGALGIEFSESLGLAIL